MKEKIDRKKFYKQYRKYFAKRISQKQVNSFEAMFDYWESKPKLTDKRWLAYCLATAYHETGAKMQPVREGFCKTDNGSIKAVTKMFKKGRIAHNYAVPEKNGQSYFGRGLVQITHGYNYKRVGRSIGIGKKLYNNPSLALQLDVSVEILFVGMQKGLFTGRKLRRYFNKRVTDWINARKIVNGKDKAELIARYGMRFFECVK